MKKIVSFDNFKINELSSVLADKASKVANDQGRYGQAATFNNYAVNNSFGDFIGKNFSDGVGQYNYTITEVSMYGKIKLIKRKTDTVGSVIYVQYNEFEDKFNINSKESTNVEWQHQHGREPEIGTKLYIDKIGGQLFWKISKILNPETKITPNNLGDLIVKK